MSEAVVETTGSRQVEPGIERTGSSSQRIWWRRLLKDKAATISAIILILLGVIAIFAPLIAPADPLKTDPANSSAPVGTAGHLLGTDQVGRDILSRIIVGSRLTLLMGLSGAAFSSAVGLLLGLIAGYYGGLYDTIIMRGIDVLLAFPYILLAVVIVAILGPSLFNAILAIAILGVPFYVRLIRSEVIRLRSQEFVMAASAIGSTDTRVVMRHILPNVLAPMVVTASIHVGTLILSAAGLSFIGLGAQPPSPEWGAMISSGRDYLILAPHVVLVPAGAIFVVVLAFNVLGDGLRDALDPKTG